MSSLQCVCAFQNNNDWHETAALRRTLYNQRWAYCKQPRCTANYTWNRESGTSHPLNHYRQKHSKELDKHLEQITASQPEIATFFSKADTKIDQTEKMAKAFCMAQHNLPFSFFDDPIMEWGFNFSWSSRTMKLVVESLFEKTKTSVKNISRGKKESIGIDGWTNPTTHDKHLCIVAKPITMKQNMIFIFPTVVNESLTAEVLHHLLFNVTADLQAFGFYNDRRCGRQCCCTAKSVQNAEGRISLDCKTTFCCTYNQFNF